MAAAPRPAVIAVLACGRCGDMVVCWDGYCVRCLAAAIEALEAPVPEAPAPERIVRAPAPRDELLTVLESVVAYTFHKPQCPAWDARVKGEFCTCGLAGLRERARALREGGV